MHVAFRPLRANYIAPDAQQDLPYERFRDWLQTLADPIGGQRIERKEDITLFVPALMSGGVSDAHVRELSALVYDIDGATPEQTQALLTQSQSLGKGLCYTTHSNGVKKPVDCVRFRILFPLEHACDVSIHAMVRKQIQDVLFGAIYHGGLAEQGRGIGTLVSEAEKCANPSRPWYLPARNPAAPAPVWFLSWEGPGGARINAQAWAAKSALATVYTDASAPALTATRNIEILQASDLVSLATKLEKSQSESKRTVGRTLKRLVGGFAYASAGERDNLLFQVTGEIAKAFPYCDPDSVAEICALGLHRTQQETGEGAPTQKAFSEKLRKATSAAQHKLSLESATREALQAGIGAARPVSPLSPGASDAGTGEGEAGGLPMMVKYNGMYWLRDPPMREQQAGTPGDFCHFFSSSDIHLTVSRDYADQLMVRNLDGTPRSQQAIEQDYCVAAESVVRSFLATHTTFDMRARKLTIASARRCDIKPEHDPQIEEWLRHMCDSSGPDAERTSDTDFRALCTWLGSLWALDMPAPALYLHGVSSAGKGLLASGLSRIWQGVEKPVSLYEITETDFNGTLTKCPLVVADEGLPRKADLEWLRAFLTEEARSINEKHEKRIPLLGYVRLMVLSNNAHTISLKRQSLTQEDTLAISKRLLPIYVHGNAARYLEQEHIKKQLMSWVNDHRIAAFARWCEEAYPVDRIQRFAVQGGQSQRLVQAIAGERYGWFVSWLLDYLENPTTLEIRYQPGAADAWHVRTKQGALLVSQKASRYLNGPGTGRYIDHSEFKDALHYYTLQSVDGPVKKQLRVGAYGSREWYYVIDMSLLFQGAAGENGTPLDVASETCRVDTETRLERGSRPGGNGHVPLSTPPLAPAPVQVPSIAQQGPQFGDMRQMRHDISGHEDGINLSRSLFVAMARGLRSGNMVAQGQAQRSR